MVFPASWAASMSGGYASFKYDGGNINLGSTVSMFSLVDTISEILDGNYFVNEEYLIYRFPLIVP